MCLVKYPWHRCPVRYQVLANIYNNIRLITMSDIVSRAYPLPLYLDNTHRSHKCNRKYNHRCRISRSAPHLPILSSLLQVFM